MKKILILREISNIMAAIVLIHLIFLATTLTTPIMVIMEVDITVTMIITIMGMCHQQFLSVGMSLYSPLFCQLEFA
jgi:hypothetical protein